MNTLVRSALFLAGTLLASGASAAVEPTATSPVVEFQLDTRSSPRPIKTSADVAELWTAPFFAGETVTLTAPDGTQRVLAENAAAAGQVTFDFTAGGVWKVSNSVQGDAFFTVRHSIFGTRGTGRPDAPAKIVDDAELFDILSAGAAGDGFVFTLDGMPDFFPVLPYTYLAVAAGEKLWRLTPVEACTDVAEPLTYAMDTRQSGPDRTLTARRPEAIAYSGDKWTFNASAPSTLTVVSPDAAAETRQLTGTGLLAYPFRRRGVYTVSLTAADETETSLVTFDPPHGFIIRLH
jgi:hypothetical protein